jgi:pimeloyl-ACP methyl ester carboxylesterase
MVDLGLRAMLLKSGVTERQADDLALVDAATWDGMLAAIRADPKMRWVVIQRGFWVHGVDNLADFFRAASALTLAGRLERIRCPTLLTAAENDRLSAGAERLLAELECPKTLIRFAAAEGAGEHCELYNRSLANRRMLDWLDATFAMT